MTLTQIPTREILHFLGWHGTPVEPGLMETIKRFQEKALRKIEPRVVVREFELLPDGTLAHTHFLPLGKDVPAMLSDCRLFCWRQRWARRANACSFGNSHEARRMH